jgi:ribosome maturation factor RimP
MSQNVGQEDRTLARVRALAQPIAAALGVDLADILWTTEAGKRTLRVTIERVSVAPSGADADHGWGVTLEDCADLSRDLSRVLDEEDAVPGAFNLEVSSPGLDRPLYSFADYRRFVGQLAKAKLSRPAPDGQRALRGAIESVSDAGGDARVTMEVDGKSITVPFADIVEGHLVFELSGAPRPGKSRPGKPSAAAKKAATKPGLKPAGAAKKLLKGGGAAAAGATIEERSLGRKANVRSES